VSALGELWSYVTTASNWTGEQGLLALTWDHVRLSALAVAAAVVLAVPAGVLLGHRRRGGAAAASVVNIGRALPSFAVLVLAFSVFSEWGRGLTIWPTFVALVLLAVPPMFTNVYTGVSGVDPLVRESAEGMGMRPRQRLWRVEAPIALPLVLTGVRVATVQVIATATLGAWVGFKCLGTLIFEGFAQQDDGKILTGAVFVALLTVLAEIGFSLLERVVVPWRRPSGHRHRQASTMVTTTAGRTGPAAEPGT
jgi:osmoprotectant transport system permease protein